KSPICMNLAWLIAGSLTYPWVSILFALPTAKERFIGVVDGMVFLVPLAVVLVVVFGKPYLLGTPERWEAAILFMVVNTVDVFSGYAFHIALSRRIFAVNPVPRLPDRVALTMLISCAYIVGTNVFDPLLRGCLGPYLIVCQVSFRQPCLTSQP